MKKVLTISVLLSIGFVFGVLWKELTVHAAGGGGVPVGNGDVNGDGTIDMSDAVYLLSNLFLGGPAPKAVECPPPAEKRLSATGQMKCYDERGAEMACDNATCPGQDGSYKSGCPSEGRFVDNGDGTVSDTCTGLMWQKDTAPVRSYWQDALNYCENLNLADHDDWRLPNIRELQSIVDYGRFNPAIDPVFGAVSKWYWSSTSWASNPEIAWYVFFEDGLIGKFDKDTDYYVRAVRGGL